MSVHECEKCGHQSHPFGAGGGERISAELGVPLIGQLPLSLDIRLQADGGTPTVRAAPQSQASELYRMQRGICSALVDQRAVRADHSDG